MTGPSAGCALKELEQVQVLNENLDYENIGEFSLDDDRFFFYNDYTQFVTPGTYVIGDSVHDNGSNEP
jgi:hypothetical protein